MLNVPFVCVPCNMRCNMCLLVSQTEKELKCVCVAARGNVTMYVSFARGCVFSIACTHNNWVALIIIWRSPPFILLYLTDPF